MDRSAKKWEYMKKKQCTRHHCSYRIAIFRDVKLKEKKLKKKKRPAPVPLRRAGGGR